MTMAGDISDTRNVPVTAPGTWLTWTLISCSYEDTLMNIFNITLQRGN